MTIDVLLAAVAALAVAVVALALYVLALERRLRRAVWHYRRLREGVRGERLDELLEGHLAATHDAAAEALQAIALCDQLDLRLRQALQQVGVVRFNPFDDTGGDQSFSVAVTNAEGDGFVLSSLHGRSGSRVYAKPVRGGTSRYTLSKEEEQALLEASLTRGTQPS